MRYTTQLLCLSLMAASSSCSIGSGAGVSDAELAARGMRTEINDLRHAVSSMDMELELLHSKCDTQASLLSDLQHQIDRDDLESERALGSSVAQINRSLRDLEDLQASLQDDLRQMKSYLNDDRLALSQQKQKLNELEGNVGILHKAMSGLSQLADEASPATDGGSEYSVQAGDNLEKIARRHATSVRRLKDLNDLTSDVIRVGQKLRLR